MGTTGIALFSDDTAHDVREDFIARLASGASPSDATQSLVGTWAVSIQDVDDGPVFWLALAATQWDYGCLSPEVLAHAIETIDSEADLRRWDGPLLSRRKAVLTSLRQKLVSPQPPFRRPRRRKPILVPSRKVESPDGRALATAYELGASAVPGAPRMQVMVELESSGARGGGGVFVADCDYTQVSLEWIDSETLQIGYPSSAVLSAQPPTFYYYGRTVKLLYRALVV